MADLEPATLLADDARTIELRGRRVQIAGVDPRTFRRRLSQPEKLVDESADLRILLCHYPDVIDRLPEGAFDLVLSGHLHAGQICVPWPGGRLRLAHIRWSYIRGLYRRPAATLHLSAGLGTTFVPVPLPRAAGGDRADPRIRLMEGTASVAVDVLASYAADAAREVEGVAGLVEGQAAAAGRRSRRRSRTASPSSSTSSSQPALSAQEVGAEVQRRVADYLERMAGARPSAVDVVIEEIA